MVGAILYALAVVSNCRIKSSISGSADQCQSRYTGDCFETPRRQAVGAFLSGVISAAWTNFGPVFGQQVGMSSALIATLLAAALLGQRAVSISAGQIVRHD